MLQVRQLLEPLRLLWAMMPAVRRSALLALCPRKAAHLRHDWTQPILSGNGL